MHSALVFVEKPKSFLGGQSELNWNATVQALHGVALKYPTIEALGESCLLVPMTEGADAFSDALRAASSGAYAYRVLFFKKKPNWIHSTPSAVQQP